MKSSPKATLSPRVILTPLEINNGTIQVVRDDKLIGGTKQRALDKYLTDAIANGLSEFVYASPPPGYGQVALAYSCQQLNVACTLFCWQLNDEYHEFSLLAESFGAKIYPCKSLEDADAAAIEYAKNRPGCIRLPLGFDVPDYIQCLRNEISVSWRHITEDLGYEPERVWLPVGSTILSNVFRDVVPEEIILNCVTVRLLEEQDARIQKITNRPNVNMFSTQERFLDPRTDPPAIPSNAHYDAKVWQFIKTHGQDKDIWWNVAK
ncbi:hypothetical protein [Pedobacter cryoconitis]|uniref:Uncharacterized protein n=1 Tax=Pedobacter cryoconitis TaxID=188932 RepID=A0A7X0J4D7_9SPHI|nr:hypothetical protein [Pedobacter cryoconitis]MBB6499421.1 hypothetical protein [Pedobacter cryoconitis]